MSPSGKLSWLCCLIDESLRSYTEPEVAILICKEKEKEREVLIALSQVLREIELRVQDSESNKEKVVLKTAPSKEYSCDLNPHSAAHHCLSRILTDMLILLTIKSQFVQHLAVKALVLTSKFVTTTRNSWNEFIQFLCCFLEVAIARSVGENSNSDISDSKFLKKFGWKYCDWSTVAGINQVLRAIFKYLKEDYDDQFVNVYYDSVNSFLSKVPWDKLDQYQLCFTNGIKKSSSRSPFHLNNLSAMEPRINFLGTFLQLLCSLVDRNDCAETGDGSANEHPLLVTVVNLLPRIVKWCLNGQGGSSHYIMHYFKHKLLVLMTRLSSYKCLDCSILLSWLKLLHNYFQELLQQPLTQFQFDEEKCLEGSPFLFSLSDREVSGMQSSHLQRQAVFLLLDFSSSLISQKGDPAGHRICSTLNSCLTNNFHPKSDYCCVKMGLLEIYKWLQGHLPTDISIYYEKYSCICVNFMSSFLQLYLGEDDLLFEVLLQLLGITSCLQQQFDENEAAFQDINNDFPFCVLDVFNPVRLFHLFLSEIHYDHEVLLDYLISKDTGISCAKYLLRCLSMVCNSWESFLEFPLSGAPLNQSSSKKRKAKWEDSEFLVDVTPFTVDSKGIIPSHEANYEDYGFKHSYTQAYKEAKDCLLSLKDSVDNLHQKKLFPYNPEVLLKRLKKFEDLSCEVKGLQEYKTDQ